MAADATLDVRPYRPADREPLLAIAADTAFFGEPVERLLDDRRLFLDLMYRDYLDREAELSWVAVDPGGIVVGFVAGSADTRRRRRRWLVRVLPRVIAGVFGGRYRLGRRTLRYAAARLRAWVRHGAPAADPGTFPAHLHVNVGAAARGRGAGRRLVETFLERMRERGVRGIHVSTTDANAVACRLYESLGFRLISSAISDAWLGSLGRRVEIRIYGRALDPP